MTKKQELLEYVTNLTSEEVERLIKALPLLKETLDAEGEQREELLQKLLKAGA